MKRLIFLLILLSFFFIADAQKYITKDGFISFFSHTPTLDFRGDNNQVASTLDISSGELVFEVLIKSFHFDKAHLEEHFNEIFMESGKYPKSYFKGRITNLSSVDFKKNGTHEVTVEGDLTIHNVTNKITSKGTVEVVRGGINATSKFNIIPENYKISIPGIAKEKIAKNLEVTVTIKYPPL